MSSSGTWIRTRIHPSRGASGGGSSSSNGAWLALIVKFFFHSIDTFQRFLFSRLNLHIWSGLHSNCPLITQFSIIQRFSHRSLIKFPRFQKVFLLFLALSLVPSAREHNFPRLAPQMPFSAHFWVVSAVLEFFYGLVSIQIFGCSLEITRREMS